MTVMAFTSGPLAAISAALLVLSESSTLFTILSKTFLIEDALTDTFDGVLVSKNTANLVSEGRQIKAGGDPMAKLGKLVLKPFQSTSAPRKLVRPARSVVRRALPIDADLRLLHRVHAHCAYTLRDVSATQLHSGRWNRDVCHSTREESWAGCACEILPVEAMERGPEREAY